MRALWDNFRFNKPKNKYSLEHLKYLYSIISKNPIINEQNKVIIIETLRQIAELLIWGDQHNSVFFDYFLEKNLLAFFLNILDQKTSKNVKVQLLQTLSILIENIRAQNSLYYLFSNNHVNELIIHRFDFSDEEVLAYYISLLKTLSLKLDRSTIQFFFNAQENDFPLYTEAIKFFNHEEGMIRIAVRTLTLNVYRVEDEAMRKYILNSTAVPYFSNIVWFIRQQCHTLDQMVRTLSHDNRRKLDDFVAEMLDHFYYLHDIFCLGIESMSSVLSEQLLHYLLTPLLVESLGANASNISDKQGQDDEKISPVLALFLLAQVFTVFTHKPLINTLAAALIHPDPSTFSTLKQQCPVGPPPPLSDLAPKRTHYVSFRRFSSVPNLEALEAVSLKGTQSAPPSPVPPATHDSSAIAIKSPHQPSLNEPRDSGFTSASPSKSSPALLSLDEPLQESPPSEGAEIPTIEIEDYSEKDLDTSSPKTSTGQIPTEENTEKGRNIHRDALLGFFEDDRTALNALCMLTALIKNEAVDRDLLEVGGLFPYRLTKAKYLLDILTSNSPAKPQAPAITHLREEQHQHHTRSKSDSHAVAIAITDLNLRRKALLNTMSTDTSVSLNSEGTDSGTAPSLSATDPNTSTSPSSSEPHNIPANKPQRSIPQLKKPLPQTPTRSEEVSKHSTSHQHAFTHSLIGRLLSLLAKSNQYRLVTLQLTLIMLKELVCSPDSPPGLTPRQLASFEKAYQSVSTKFEKHLSGEIFLELFDVEVKNYKPPNFENLIKDAALLLPVSGTSKSRLDLARRLPSSETEITQQAIQQYLVLRELKYTILHKKDDVLPHLKHHIPAVSVLPKDQYTIDSTAECIVIPFAIVVQGASVLKKRQKRLLVANKETLIVLDPTNVSKPPPKPADPQPQADEAKAPSHTAGHSSGSGHNLVSGHNSVSGTIVHAAPLQSINIEIDRNDPLVLQVTSHQTTWSMPMVFEDEKKCQAAYELLMVARNELRIARIHKIRTLLVTSTDNAYVSGNPSNSIGIKEENAGGTNSEDGIDSIIDTVETINKISKTSKNQRTFPHEEYHTHSGFASELLETTDTDLTDHSEHTEHTEPTELIEHTEPTEHIDLTENTNLELTTSTDLPDMPPAESPQNSVTITNANPSPTQPTAIDKEHTPQSVITGSIFVNSTETLLNDEPLPDDPHGPDPTQYQPPTTGPVPETTVSPQASTYPAPQLPTNPAPADSDSIPSTTPEPTSTLNNATPLVIAHTELAEPPNTFNCNTEIVTNDPTVIEPFHLTQDLPTFSPPKSPTLNHPSHSSTSDQSELADSRYHPSMLADFSDEHDKGRETSPTNGYSDNVHSEDSHEAKQIQTPLSNPASPNSTNPFHSVCPNFDTTLDLGTATNDTQHFDPTTHSDNNTQHFDPITLSNNTQHFDPITTQHFDPITHSDDSDTPLDPVPLTPPLATNGTNH